MDKISIIIPVYNTGELLRDCYDSLKKQTFSNLELIFINDGSTDNSLSLLKELTSSDPRAIIIDQKNQGLSATRNIGIKKATGKYITFLDGDDFLADDAIEYLYGLIKKDRDILISACSHIEYKDEKHQKDFNNSVYKTRVMSIEDGLDSMLNEKGFNLQSTVKLFKKDLFDNVKFPEGKFHEDVGTTYKLFLSACEKGGRIAYGSKPKYYYRMKEESISHKKFTEQKLDLITLTDKMCDEIDATFGKLKDTTNLRRLHARFSILRMLAAKGKLTTKELKIWREQKDYVMEHRSWIKANKEATKRDKLALFTLKLGKPIFSAAWKIYGAIF